MSDDRRLRAWRGEDAPSLAAAWADPEIARWNPVPETRDLAAAEAWIARAAGRSEDANVVDRVMVDDHDEVIGELGLRIDRERRVAEAGFWIARHRRGRGEGTRLLTLASRLADNLGLRGLIAVTDADNAGAVALLEAAGWLEVKAHPGHRAFVDRQI